MRYASGHMSQTNTIQGSHAKPSVARPKYSRKSTPVVVQYLIGGVIYGIATPLIKSLEMLGKAENVLGGFNANINRNIAKNNPFRDYIPGKQDVFDLVLAPRFTRILDEVYAAPVVRVLPFRRS